MLKKIRSFVFSSLVFICCTGINCSAMRSISEENAYWTQMRERLERQKEEIPKGSYMVISSYNLSDDTVYFPDESSYDTIQHDIQDIQYIFNLKKLEMLAKDNMVKEMQNTTFKCADCNQGLHTKPIGDAQCDLLCYIPYEKHYSKIVYQIFAEAKERLCLSCVKKRLSESLKKFLETHNIKTHDDLDKYFDKRSSNYEYLKLPREYYNPNSFLNWEEHDTLVKHYEERSSLNVFEAYLDEQEKMNSYGFKKLRNIKIFDMMTDILTMASEGKIVLDYKKDITPTKGSISENVRRYQDQTRKDKKCLIF